MVFSVFRFFPPLNRRGQLVELLRSVADLARPIPGCLGCWLAEEDSFHSYVRYAEQWQSPEALYDHIRSDLYRRLLAALELSKQEPEVKFYLCSETKGFDLIEAVRQSAKSSELVGKGLFPPSEEPVQKSLKSTVG